MGGYIEDHTDETAYSRDNLKSLLDSNENAPSLTDEQVDRLVEHVEFRFSRRETTSALDETETECVICTTWDSFAGNEFGYDGEVNQFAVGVMDEDISSGKGATLFTDVDVVQNGWLSTGDGRKSQYEKYEDDEYDKAEEGEMWIPNGAQDYICILAISPELAVGEPDASEAM